MSTNPDRPTVVCGLQELGPGEASCSCPLPCEAPPICEGQGCGHCDECLRNQPVPTPPEGLDERGPLLRLLLAGDTPNLEDLR